MAWDDLGRQAMEENKRDRDRLISVWIGVLAVLLAICGMGGSNATKDSTLKNIEASNTWAFFQAKNMRREARRIEAEQLEFMIAANPQMPEAARFAIADKLKALKAGDERLSNDPEKVDTNGKKSGGEGLDQLFQKAKSLEAERDTAMKRDPYFDYGTALLQIAIVLASVAIISEGLVLLFASAAIGAIGALMTLNGFTLWFALPFVG
jgi:Domain of unknown function (DUF4337)